MAVVQALTSRWSRNLDASPAFGFSAAAQSRFARAVEDRRSSGRSERCNGEANDDPRPPPVAIGRLELECSSVSLRDFPDDGEPEAGTVARATLDAIEP